MSYSCIWATSI